MSAASRARGNSPMVAPPLAAMREALVADALHAGQAQTAGELVGLRVVEIGPGGRESNGRAAGRRDRRSVTSDTHKGIDSNATSPASRARSLRPARGSRSRVDATGPCS